MNRQQTEAAARANRPVPQAPPKTTQPIAYAGHGFGVEPCPGCGDPLLPGEPRLVRPGEWRPYHALCMDCTYCEESHPLPHDGSCLL